MWSELERQVGVELPSPRFKTDVVDVDESVASDYEEHDAVLELEEQE